MSNKPKDEADAEQFEGVIIEGDDESSDSSAPDGLELDAQQAAEIRQIFLTSLPDYLVPIKEMVIKLSSEPDETGEIRAGLAKTIQSIGDAADRMKLDDVTHAMSALREDIVLFGDPSEPQDALRKRITDALASLDRLAGGAAASVKPEARGETIVAALRGSDVIDNSVVQRLLAAGVAYVDQVLDADPKEVAIVSGLDAATVAKLVAALKAKRRPPPPKEPPQPPKRPRPAEDANYSAQILDLDEEHPASTGRAAADVLGFLDSRSKPPPPSGGFQSPFKSVAPASAPPPKDADALAATLRRIVQDELALEEARGQATRLHASIAALRASVAALERECDSMRRSIGEHKGEAVARLTDLARVESRKSAIERDRAQTLADLETAEARLNALHVERRAVLDQLRSLGDDTAALSEHVANVLDSYS
jgi:hypothetical protein